MVIAAGTLVTTSMSGSRDAISAATAGPPVSGGPAFKACPAATASVMPTSSWDGVCADAERVLRGEPFEASGDVAAPVVGART
jgi:hypothetical protein